MAKKKSGSSPVMTRGESRPTPRPEEIAEKPIALSLKVDSDLYVRLSTARAKERRTAQDILRQALLEYLDRVGA